MLNVIGCRAKLPPMSSEPPSSGEPLNKVKYGANPAKLVPRNTFNIAVLKDLLNPPVIQNLTSPTRRTGAVPVRITLGVSSGAYNNILPPDSES